MPLETKDALDQATIDAIQELIEINLDSYNGFTQAADLTTQEMLSSLFREMASERAAQAVELKALVRRNDEQPVNEGSFAGQIHRTIMDWRQAFGGGALAVLKEAERGEDYIKAKYEAALARTAGSAVTDVLNRQYAAIKTAHDRVRGLRDTLAAS